MIPSRFMRSFVPIILLLLIGQSICSQLSPNTRAGSASQLLLNLLFFALIAQRIVKFMDDDVAVASRWMASACAAFVASSISPERVRIGIPVVVFWTAHSVILARGRPATFFAWHALLLYSFIVQLYFGSATPSLIAYVILSGGAFACLAFELRHRNQTQGASSQESAHQAAVRFLLGLWATSLVIVISIFIWSSIAP